MKVWPIITLVGLIYGSTLADPKGVGRESNPHPRTIARPLTPRSPPTSPSHTAQ